MELHRQETSDGNNRLRNRGGAYEPCQGWKGDIEARNLARRLADHKGGKVWTASWVQAPHENVQGHPQGLDKTV